MHVDVGRPRFWEPATSKVEQNISAGNARIFARTDFDRYGAGDEVAVTLYAVTVPPMGVSARAKFVADDGDPGELSLAGVEGDCEAIPATGSTLHLRSPAGAHGKGHIVLTTCDPRPEQTPATIETNAIELR